MTGAVQAYIGTPAVMDSMTELNPQCVTNQPVAYANGPPQKPFGR